VQYDRTKHVELDCHFIKNNLEERDAKIFDSSLDKLEMVDIYHPM
jgi:hypothetical protein